MKDEEFRVDVYNNWHDNPMVKVTHLPSGIVETCDAYKSVHENRETAKNRIAVKLGVANPDRSL
jgi:protein subunit release factor A